MASQNDLLIKTLTAKAKRRGFSFRQFAVTRFVGRQPVNYGFFETAADASYSARTVGDGAVYYPMFHRGQEIYPLESEVLNMITCTQ